MEKKDVDDAEAEACAIFSGLKDEAQVTVKMFRSVAFLFVKKISRLQRRLDEHDRVETRDRWLIKGGIGVLIGLVIFFNTPFGMNLVKAMSGK